MNVISKQILLQKTAKHADALAAIQTWFEFARKAKWRSLEDIRKDYPATDMVGPLAIFNVKGNHYRLIVYVSFRHQRLYVKEFLTHAEYDKGAWKKWL